VVPYQGVFSTKYDGTSYYPTHGDCCSNNVCCYRGYNCTPSQFNVCCRAGTILCPIGDGTCCETSEICLADTDGNPICWTEVSASEYNGILVADAILILVSVPDIYMDGGLLDCGSLIADSCTTYSRVDSLPAWVENYNNVYSAGRHWNVFTEYASGTTSYSFTTVEGTPEVTYTPSILPTPSSYASPCQIRRDTGASKTPAPNSHSETVYRRIYEWDRCTGDPTHDLVTNSLADLCPFIINAAASNLFVSLKPTPSAYMPSWVGYLSQFCVSFWNLLSFVVLHTVIRLTPDL
jgi:hypothetical protein